MSGGKKILILSPQPWNHIYISKHHYAIEFARNNNVWFISAPEKSLPAREHIESVENTAVTLIRYNFRLNDFFKFHIPGLYRRLLRKRLYGLIQKEIGPVDICIDFGCYQLFDKLDFVEAGAKIFFPVDDHEYMEISKRGCDKVYSVSKNVLQKLAAGNIEGEFINHGIAAEFSKYGTEKLKNNQTDKPVIGNKVRIGYAGNLFIPFLDINVFQKLISANGQVEFVFFGAAKCDNSIAEHAAWFKFLKESENVIMKGVVSPAELVAEYDKLDGFILCYKPDYKNYHAENSHKVLEYMSTGKVIISTYLSLYENSELLNMAAKNDNVALLDVFRKTIAEIDYYNSIDLQTKRIEFALNNSYARHIEKIFSDLKFRKSPNFQIHTNK